jgi:hypothetical protein
MCNRGANAVAALVEIRKEVPHRSLAPKHLFLGTQITDFSSLQIQALAILQTMEVSGQYGGFLDVHRFETMDVAFTHSYSREPKSRKYSAPNTLQTFCSSKGKKSPGEVGSGLVSPVKSAVLP